MSMDFSSWPREQEATFVVYEQRANEVQKKAWTISLIVAGVFLLAVVGIAKGVDPDTRDIAKGMNMDNLTGGKNKPSAEKP